MTNGQIDHPVWRGPREEAKRGPPCGHRITRNEGAMVPLLLPCATTGLSSIAAWCGSGATPRGQQGSPACTLPHVRDGLRVRCRATWCPCGRPSKGRPVHHPFLRNALPDLTTMVPVTAYSRINYVETYSRYMDCCHVSGVYSECSRSPFVFIHAIEGQHQTLWKWIKSSFCGTV